MIENPVTDTTQRPKKMLTADQAADKVGMAKSTFYEKVRKGIVPKGYKYEHTDGLRWVEYELEDWLDKNLIPA